MVQLHFPDEMSASEPTDTGWSYWRPGLDDVVEVGTLRGQIGLVLQHRGVLVLAQPTRGSAAVE